MLNVTVTFQLKIKREGVSDDLSITVIQNKKEAAFVVFWQTEADTCVCYFVNVTVSSYMVAVASSQVIL